MASFRFTLNVVDIHSERINPMSDYIKKFGASKINGYSTELTEDHFFFV